MNGSHLPICTLDRIPLQPTTSRLLNTEMKPIAINVFWYFANVTG